MSASQGNNRDNPIPTGDKPVDSIIGPLLEQQDGPKDNPPPKQRDPVMGGKGALTGGYGWQSIPRGKK